MKSNIEFLGYVRFEEYSLNPQFLFNGEIITPTEESYLTTNNLYQASATDSNGEKYMIEWKITHPDFENLEDEEEACNWTEPSKIYKI